MAILNMMTSLVVSGQLGWKARKNKVKVKSVMFASASSSASCVRCYILDPGDRTTSRVKSEFSKGGGVIIIIIIDIIFTEGNFGEKKYKKVHSLYFRIYDNKQFTFF